MEDDPKKLWDSLKERYNQQQSVILPEARWEWSLLRLMEFKSIAEYNSAVQGFPPSFASIINLWMMHI